MEEIKTHCVNCKFNPLECGMYFIAGKCKYFEPKEKSEEKIPEFETTIRAV